MTDWSSPTTLQRNAVSTTMLHHALLGIFVWEMMATLDFDVSFLTGRRRFKWPIIFYFLGRYAMLGCLVGGFVLLNSPIKLNCQVGVGIVVVLGNTAVVFASLNLCLRALAVWDRQRKVVITAVLMIIGHFVIVIRATVTIQSSWHEVDACTHLELELDVFAIMFGYTMLFDLIILILTAYKLWNFYGSDTLPLRGKRGVAKLLFQDGLVYFVIAFVVNAIALIFSLLQLSPIMGKIADLPAITISTIASGRVVRRLSTHNETAAQYFSGLVPTISIGNEPPLTAHATYLKPEEEPSISKGRLL